MLCDSECFIPVGHHAEPPPPAAPKPNIAPPRAPDTTSLDDGPENWRLSGIEDDPSVIGCEVSNGVCGLLYSSFQLHTSMRKISQVHLLQVWIVRELRGLRNEVTSYELLLSLSP